jgi:hypothetical protein
MIHGLKNDKTGHYGANKWLLVSMRNDYDFGTDSKPRYTLNPGDISLSKTYTQIMSVTRKAGGNIEVKSMVYFPMHLVGPYKGLRDWLPSETQTFTPKVMNNHQGVSFEMRMRQFDPSDITGQVQPDQVMAQVHVTSYSQDKEFTVIQALQQLQISVDPVNPAMNTDVALSRDNINYRFTQSQSIMRPTTENNEFRSDDFTKSASTLMSAPARLAVHPVSDTTHIHSPMRWHLTKFSVHESDAVPKKMTGIAYILCIRKTFTALSAATTSDTNAAHTTSTSTSQTDNQAYLCDSQQFNPMILWTANPETLSDGDKALLTDLLNQLTKTTYEQVWDLRSKSKDMVYQPNQSFTAYLDDLLEEIKPFSWIPITLEGAGGVQLPPSIIHTSYCTPFTGANSHNMKHFLTAANEQSTDQPFVKATNTNNDVTCEDGLLFHLPTVENTAELPTSDVFEVYMTAVATVEEESGPGANRRTLVQTRKLLQTQSTTTDNVVGTAVFTSSGTTFNCPVNGTVNDTKLTINGNEVTCSKDSVLTMPTTDASLLNKTHNKADDNYTLLWVLIGLGIFIVVVTAVLIFLQFRLHKETYKLSMMLARPTARPETVVAATPVKRSGLM